MIIFAIWGLVWWGVAGGVYCEQNMSHLDFDNKQVNFHQINPNSCSDTDYFYWPQRSCGQGNIFTPVCHSVHRGGMSEADPLGADTDPPLEQTPPWEQTPHLGADTPQEQTPLQKFFFLDFFFGFFGGDLPPPKLTQAYGQRAAGTHPTGMHSCFRNGFYNMHVFTMLLRYKGFSVVTNICCCHL